MAPSPLLPQRQGDCPHGVGVSQGATLLILPVTSTPCPPPFLKIYEPPFLNFFIIDHRKKINQNDVEFDLSIGHALPLFSDFLNNRQKMYSGPCTSPPSPPKFIYIGIFIYLYILHIKHYFHQIL